MPSIYTSKMMMLLIWNEKRFFLFYSFWIILLTISINPLLWLLQFTVILLQMNKTLVSSSIK